MPCRLGVTFRIAVPAAVSAAAAPIVIVVIVARGLRACEPAFVVPRRHIIPAIVIIVAIAAMRTATLIPPAA